MIILFKLEKILKLNKMKKLWINLGVILLVNIQNDLLMIVFFHLKILLLILSLKDKYKYI